MDLYNYFLLHEPPLSEVINNEILRAVQWIENRRQELPQPLDPDLTAEIDQRMARFICCDFRGSNDGPIDMSHAHHFLAMTPLRQRSGKRPAPGGGVPKAEKNHRVALNGHLRKYLKIRVHSKVFYIDGRHTPLGLAVCKRLMEPTELPVDVVAIEIIGWGTVMESFDHLVKVDGEPSEQGTDD
jgi:hypothetical protein